MANATGRTGQVTLSDFDVAVAEALGAELIEIALDGEMAPEYAANIPGVTGPSSHGGFVPVVFDSPEDVFQENVMPIIKITRSSLTPAMQRWFPGGHEYRVPAAMSKEVTSSGGEKGPSLVETKPWATPFDIQYDIHLKGRLRAQAQSMLNFVGRWVWSYGQVFVKDSLGDSRGYYAFMESIDTLDEISDVADRSSGFTLSVRVEGELDFVEPTVERTTPDQKVGTGVL